MSFLDDILGESSALEKILEANWQDPAASIVRGLGLADTRQVMDASDRLDLWGEGACWLVLSGSLDILWSCPEGRVYLGKVEAGGLAAALSAEGTEVHAIAIPSEDTEVVQTTLEVLHGFSGQNGTVPIESLLTTWLETVGTGKTSLQQAALGASPDAFRQALTEASAAILEEGAAQFGSMRHSRDTRSEVSRLKVEANVAAALAETVELVDRHFRPTETGGATFHSVARQVLRATGYLGSPEMVLPRTDDSEMDLAVRFCRRNNLQLRAVRLDEKWWSGDHGALLGYMRDTREPVALLNVPGGYEISTPQGRKRVTPQIAATIDPLVYAFFLPTPEGEQNPWLLMRFGLFGRGRDVRNIIFCLVLGAIFSLVAPISIGWLMGSVIPSAEMGQVKVFTALLLVTAAATAMTGIVQSLAALRMEGGMQYRVQTAVWVHILNLRAQFFRKYNAGDLANRADSVDAMRSTAAQAVSMLMTSCVGAVFSLLLMFYYDWKVTLMVLLVSLVFSVVAIVYGKLILSYNQKVLDQSGKLQGLMLQITNTVPKLRVAGAENRAFAYWMREYRAMVGLSLHQSIQNYRLKVIRSAFPYLLSLVVLGMIGFQLGILFDFFASTPLPVEKGNLIMPTSRFVSLNVAIGQFTSAMFMATRGILHFYLLKPHYNRVLPILEAEPEEDADYEELTEIRGDVELRDVTFRYSTTTGLVLSNLSFIAEQNKTTALVGTSGAGKSTILRLLLGFDEPESGTVLVDGNDVAFLNKKSLRQLFGVVIQDGSLLSGSIYDNVAVGHPYTMEEVSEALEIAGFAEEIKSWPMGLNTMIGDGAAMMSKGQQQRLMIARAVIRKPRILLLDEATSALDNITQARVTENLNKMNCTQIIVAHRLSTIKTADKIIVLDKGQVAEEGTFDELIAANGQFARLVMRQMK